MGAVFMGSGREYAQAGRGAAAGDGGKENGADDGGNENGADDGAVVCRLKADQEVDFGRVSAAPAGRLPWLP
jgi:hypothetical protein